MSVPCVADGPLVPVTIIRIHPTNAETAHINALAKVNGVYIVKYVHKSDDESQTYFLCILKVDFC